MQKYEKNHGKYNYPNKSLLVCLENYTFAW